MGTALASALALVLLGVLGLPGVGVLGGAGLALVATGLLAVTRPGNRTGTRPAPASSGSEQRSRRLPRLRLIGVRHAVMGAAVWRARPHDRRGAVSVRLAIAALLALPLALWFAVRCGGLPFTVPGSRLWPWRAEAGIAALLASVLYLSSLIDWTYVKPAMGGERGLGTMPCRSSTERRWRTVTRRWLGHRVAAYLALRLAVVAALVVGVVAEVLSLNVDIKQSGATVIAAVLGTGGTAILVFFLNRFVPVLTVVSNPPLQVGDQVVLAEEYGAGVAERPVYYVVDVSIEGIKLLELGLDGRPRGSHPRTHDRSLNVADAPRLLRFRGRFTGCAERCCRANPYCPLGLGERVAGRS